MNHIGLRLGIGVVMGGKIINTALFQPAPSILRGPQIYKFYLIPELLTEKSQFSLLAS